MQARTTLVVISASLLGILLVGRGVSGQVEIDRIVSRVGGRIVTQSDVRRARMLKLVEDTASDASTQRALETRLLVLQELDRAAPLPPSSQAEIDARRAEWQVTIGGQEATAGVLREVGMSAQDVDGWLRDDLRIRAYLRRQFGMLGEVERARAAGDWLTRLRQRAGLPQ